MTAPDDDTTTLGPPTDISVGPEDLETDEAPATSDPEQTSDDDELGGTAGENAGGAG